MILGQYWIPLILPVWLFEVQYFCCSYAKLELRDPLLCSRCFSCSGLCAPLCPPEPPSSYHPFWDFMVQVPLPQVDNFINAHSLLSTLLSHQCEQLYPFTTRIYSFLNKSVLEFSSGSSVAVFCLLVCFFFFFSDKVKMTIYFPLQQSKYQKNNNFSLVDVLTMQGKV